MIPFLRRHFVQTFIVFSVLSIGALALSRLFISWNRVVYSHVQAEFFADLAVRRDGDLITTIEELQKESARRGLPYDFRVIDKNSSEPTRPEEFRRDLPGGVKQLSVTVRPPPMLRQNIRVAFLFLMLASILATFLSVFLLYVLLRDKAELAKDVFRRIQSGDLKARFPVTRFDEFARSLVLFNEMADEIERLVAQLEDKERARMQLLQELAHDLRTPVSSLKNLVESVRFSGQELNPGAREELLGLAYDETEYLTNLVEDLLFLALVLEPRFKRDTAALDARELSTGLVAAAIRNYAGKSGHVAEGPPCWVAGELQLIRRLMRNALDNAFSFAEHEVKVTFEPDVETWKIRVSDDGPGFDDEALKNFGRKRGTRYYPVQGQGRLSVGLGSVIMNAIAVAHGGTLSAKNGTDGGSVLTITLPKAHLNP